MKEIQSQPKHPIWCESRAREGLCLTRSEHVHDLWDIDQPSPVVFAIDGETGEALHGLVVVESRSVIDDAHQRFIPVIECDMTRPARDRESFSNLSKCCNAFHSYAHLTALNMEDLILIDVHVLERDISAGVHGPFHCKYFLTRCKATKCLAGDRIGEGLVKINCH